MKRIINKNLINNKKIKGKSKETGKQEAKEIKKPFNEKKVKVCVVGLGYVGLPLAVEFSKYFETYGFDISKEKIRNLKKGIDPNNELDNLGNVIFSDNPKVISKANFIVVSVPTPVDSHNIPDLKYVKSASEIVGKYIKPKSIVVFESTVYPGVTEEICMSIIAKTSKLKPGIDFKIGYSPERIDPGNKEHTIEKITKIVSGQDKESLDIIARVYNKIIKAGVYKAKSIKVAESAKVIENIQRDINIALVNELALIFRKLGINTKDVLEAAGTKWNFHKYYPGIGPGGHCIGVDPYYLQYKAIEAGILPELITAGRRVNDSMAEKIAYFIQEEMNNIKKPVNGSKILVLGVAFKENVKDSRNSRAKHLIKKLKEWKADVYIYDPVLKEEDLLREFKMKSVDIDKLSDIDVIVMVTPHKEILEISLDQLKKIAKKDKPLLFDVRGIYDPEKAKNKGFIYVNL